MPRRPLRSCASLWGTACSNTKRLRVFRRAPSAVVVAVQEMGRIADGSRKRGLRVKYTPEIGFNLLKFI